MSHATQNLAQQNQNDDVRETPGSEFSAKQRAAIEALADGASVVEAAEAADVHRNSVHRWQKEEAFRRAVQKALADTQRARRARLDALAGVATDAMTAQIERGDGRLALNFLKSAGYLDGQLPGAEQLLPQSAEATDVSSEVEPNNDRQPPPKNESGVIGKPTVAPAPDPFDPARPGPLARMRELLTAMQMVVVAALASGIRCVDRANDAIDFVTAMFHRPALSAGAAVEPSRPVNSTKKRHKPPQSATLGRTDRRRRKKGRRGKLR